MGEPQYYYSDTRSAYDIAVGIAYLCLAFIFLPMHAIILTIFVRKEEFWKYPAFRIMTHMGIMECLHMCAGTLFAGVLTLIRTNFSIYVDRISGGLVVASWIGLSSFIFLLTVNRFLVFTGYHMTKRSETQFYNASIVFVWLLSSCVFGLHFPYDASLKFNFLYNVYAYTTGCMSWALAGIEFWFITTSLVVTFILCVLTVLSIIVQRSGFANEVKVCSGEIKLLIQSVIIFLYLVMIRVTLRFLPSWDTSFAAIAANILFGESMGGLNPALYLVCNRRVRRYFFDAIGWKGKTATVGVFHLATSLHSDTSLNTGKTSKSAAQTPS